MQNVQTRAATRWPSGLRLAVALFGLLCAGTAAAADNDPAPVPLEHFFQRPAVLPAVLEAKLSPSGNRLALTTSRGDNRVGLVVDLAPAIAARRVASFTDAD